MFDDQKLAELPLGVTTFRDFIDEARIYVDKTDLIAAIATYKEPVFLSRPRRFGKSTLVDTFDELFSHGLEKFAGLKIVEQKLWREGAFSVIRLDFSVFMKSAVRDFAKTFCRRLNLALKKYDDAVYDDHDPSSYLDAFMQANPNKKFVLLIDEYDAPLTAVIGKKDEFEYRRSVLSDFFSTVKRYVGRFRFIFITGVTRYSNTSIFFAFNNINDISFESRYGALTGYTQEELELYFKDYIENAVTVINSKAGQKAEDYASLIAKIKLNYDGYCFERNAVQRVYNPWSVLKFLRAPENGFLPYWMDTGGATPSILVNFLNLTAGNVLNKSEFLKYLDLEHIRPSNTDELSPNIASIEDESFPFVAILYQTGYLTIKALGANYFEIGIPNLEVKKAFAKIIVERLTSKTALQLSAAYSAKIAAALKARDFVALKAEFNKLLNEFSYESFADFKESAFRDIFNVTLLLLGFSTYTEYQTALGRSDLCFENNDILAICEFKIASSLKEAAGKLVEAKKQISERRYALRLSSREIIAFAAVIVNEDPAAGKAPLREVALLEEVV